MSPSPPVATADLGVTPDLSPLPPPPIGSACALDADCGAGRVCATTVGNSNVALPGGYCTQDCSVDNCPAGSTCVQVHGGQTCAQDCQLGVANNCGRAGYACCSFSGQPPVCSPTSICHD
jgi:hypothetical protein